jgi:hypothetical protein
MAKRTCWREIPTELSLEQFEEFILPHLTVGSRGPAPKLSLHTLFNYILKLLYRGCQRKKLPIEKDATRRREIHHVRIWRTFRRWVTDGCFHLLVAGFQPSQAPWNLNSPSKMRSRYVDAGVQ